MKKILSISLAALALLLAGCTDKRDIDIETYDGKGLEFVHFETPDDAWLVSESDKSYDYEVTVACTYKHDKDVTYNVAIGEGTTGVEGKDFSIPSKSVTIKAGQYFGTVPVKVLYDTVGEGFVLELVLSVDDVLINPIYGVSEIISVKSDKVTIDWDWLVGNWNAQDFSYYSGSNDGDPYTAAFVKNSETTCTLRGLWGAFDVVGTVDFDARTITFAGYQKGIYYETYSADLYFVAVNPETDYDTYDDIEQPVIATLSPAGIVVDNYDALLVGGPYNGYTWAGGVKTTLTR